MAITLLRRAREVAAGRLKIFRAVEFQPLSAGQLSPRNFAAAFDHGRALAQARVKLPRLLQLAFDFLDGLAENRAVVGDPAAVA
jgi:hypothetical protein